MDDTERWRRLTILDILCLFPSFALGAGIVHYAIDYPFPPNRSLVPQPWPVNPWPMDATIIGHTFVALVLGSVLAAPMSLAVQYFFRHRRIRLCMCEWLWLEPLLFCLLIYCALNAGNPSPIWLMFIQWFFSTLAFILFWILISELYNGKACYWTEFMGCISSICFLLMLIYLNFFCPRDLN